MHDIPQTLEGLFAAYLAEKRVEHATSTHNQLRLFFAALVKHFGNVPLSEVTTEVLRSWKILVANTYARGTVYRRMYVLAAALRYAVECGWLTVNPMDRIKKPSPGPGRIRFLSEQERRRLLMACKLSRSPILYPLVVLALGTGGRKNELRWLRWANVDLEAGSVRFTQTKTHLDRTVPVVGAALQVFHARAQQRQADTDLVFARPDGRKPWNMEHAWITARHVAEMDDFRFHDLRHTYASYLAMSGSSLRDIAELLGHKRIQQTMAYAHLIPSHTRPLVERMVGQFLTCEDV